MDMGKGRKDFFKGTMDLVELYFGIFKVQTMNHRIQNSGLEKKEMNLDDFLRRYRRQNDERALGSIVHYDPNREIIWGIDDSVEPPQVYFLKLPKTLSERLYCRMRRVFNRSNRNAPSGI